MDRRLAAILVADVVGYSRLMQADETGTLAALKDRRKSILDPTVRGHGGRVVKFMGDGVLVEFASAVKAVEAALKLQQKMAEANEELPDARRIVLRIGINLGDVIAEGGDLYGDGINVAARLESLSEPGGIYISGNVHEQIKNKIPIDCDDLGSQMVKNIAEPVRVYRVRIGSNDTLRSRKTPIPIRRRFQLAALGVLTLLSLAALAAYSGLVPMPFTYGERASEASRPERASIAVLPFANLSTDPAQDYFSDGLTEDIIAALGRFSELSVISHAAVQQYKGRVPRPLQLSRDLAVRYALEGSVAKDADHVRVNAQLIDTASGVLLWSDSYDDELKDVFAVRDKITQSVVGRLAIKLNELETRRAFKQLTDSLKAYDYVLRGRAADAQNTRSANIRARTLFEEAIKLDPSYAAAYTALGLARLRAAVSGWTEFRDDALREAENLAQKAIALDDANAEAHRLLGSVYFNRSQFDLAISEDDQAIALNPSDAASYAARGAILVSTGHAKGAIEAFETAKKLNPSLGSGRLEPIGWAYYLEHRYEEAVTSFNAGLRTSPDDYFISAGLAASYAQLGRQAEAARAAAATMHAFPFFEVDGFASQFQGAADRALIIDGLKKAGFT